MTDWPLEQIGRMDGVRNVNPFLGTTITASGTPNTKGAWTRVANAPFDCCGVVVMFGQNSGTGDFLIDLGVGASGSETAVVENMLVGAGSSSSRGKSLYLPLSLPSGARVAMRVQSPAASATMVVDVFFMGASFKGSPAFERFATYGAAIASSTGVTIANPAGANTWGAWTQIQDATRWDHGWVMPVIADNGITARTAGQRYALQLGVGSAGNEVPISPPLWVTASSTAVSYSFQPGWYYQVARGQRLSIRQGSSGATTNGFSGIVVAGIQGA